MICRDPLKTTSIALPAASSLPALLSQAPRPQLCVLLASLPSAPHPSMSHLGFSLAFPSPASVLLGQHPTSSVPPSLSRHLHCSSHPFSLPPGVMSSLKCGFLSFPFNYCFCGHCWERGLEVCLQTEVLHMLCATAKYFISGRETAHRVRKQRHFYFKQGSRAFPEHLENIWRRTRSCDKITDMKGRFCCYLFSPDSHWCSLPSISSDRLWSPSAIGRYLTCAASCSRRWSQSCCELSESPLGMAGTALVPQSLYEMKLSHHEARTSIWLNWKGTEVFGWFCWSARSGDVVVLGWLTALQKYCSMKFSAEPPAHSVRQWGVRAGPRAGKRNLQSLTCVCVQPAPRCPYWWWLSAARSFYTW